MDFKTRLTFAMLLLHKLKIHPNLDIIPKLVLMLQAKMSVSDFKNSVQNFINKKIFDFFLSFWICVWLLLSLYFDWVCLENLIPRTKTVFVRLKMQNIKSYLAPFAFITLSMRKRLEK